MALFLIFEGNMKVLIEIDGMITKTRQSVFEKYDAVVKKWKATRSPSKKSSTLKKGLNLDTEFLLKELTLLLIQQLESYILTSLFLTYIYIYIWLISIYLFIRIYIQLLCSSTELVTFTKKSDEEEMDENDSEDEANEFPPKNIQIFLKLFQRLLHGWMLTKDQKQNAIRMIQSGIIHKDSASYNAKMNAYQLLEGI